MSARGERETVSSVPASQHITKLLNGGATAVAIADAAGVYRGTVYTIRADGKRIEKKIESAILRLTLEDVLPTEAVDPKLLSALLAHQDVTLARGGKDLYIIELHDAGWKVKEISTAVKSSGEWVRCVITRRDAKVARQEREEYRIAYEALQRREIEWRELAEKYSATVKYLQTGKL